MAEIGKVALWALVLISVWTVCAARFHGTDFNKVQKSGYLKRLYSSDEDTRRLAHLTSQTLKNSPETSQARFIDLHKDTRDAKSFMLTEYDGHKDDPSELPYSETDIPEYLANIQVMEKPFPDFVEDRLYFINSQNAISTSYLEKLKEIFLATSNGEKVMTEHSTSGSLSSGAGTTTARNYKSSKTRSRPLDGHKSGRHRVKASHTELIPQRVTLHGDVGLPEDFKHVQGEKLMKYRRSDLAEEKSPLMMQLRFLKTNTVKNRDKRYAQYEHPYMKRNELEHKLDHFVSDNSAAAEHKSSVHTEMPDIFHETDPIVDKSNGENSKINDDDLSDSKVDVEYPESKDVDYDAQATYTSVSLPRGSDNNMDVDALSQGDVTQSTMSTKSSAGYGTLLNVIDDHGHISSTVPSLFENISPTTASVPQSTDNTESGSITNVPDISISSEMVSMNSQNQENNNYPEITTASFVHNDLYKEALDSESTGHSYKEALDSETTQWTVKSEIATSDETDYISPDAKVGVSTPFNIDTTDITHIYTSDIPKKYVTATDAHATNVYATYVTATDAHVANVHKTDATTTDASITDASITDASITDASITDAPKTDATTTDAYTTDAHTTDAHLKLNTQAEDESVSQEFSPEPPLPSSSRDSFNTNSFTTHSVNFNSSQGVPIIDKQFGHFPTNTDDSNIYPDNDSVAVRKSEDSNNFPLTEARLDWELAKETWQYAWEIHIYAFGCLFGLVGLYTTASFVRLWWIKCLFPKGYFTSVHALVVFLCCTRSFYMLYDAYGSGGTFHAGLNHFLYSVSFPCLTSSFGLVFFSLLTTTQGQLVSASIQKIQVLVFLIVVHFVISVTADVLMGFYTDIQVVHFVCHVYFITWGLFLFIGYIYVFPKLRRHALKRQNDGIYTSPCTTSGKVKSSLTLSAAVKAMFFVAVCGVVVAGMEVYAIVEVYKTFTRGYPEPWTWWLYHTVLRTIEVVVYLTLSYVVSLPLRYRRSENKYSCGVFCAPCSEIFCCGYNLNNPNPTAGFNHCEQVPSSENGDNLTENSSKKLLYNHLTDIIPTFDIQPTFGSRPNSLLIVEDGYVRFQTDYDINRIVDSCNDLSQRPAEVKNVSTFLRGDGCVNTGYSLHSREDNSNNNKPDTDLTDKSRKSSITNSDFFRVPSSVSLADSMENEISKAFESFKMDESEEDHKAIRSTNLVETSNFQDTHEPDLVSLASNPESGAKSNMATHNQSKPTYRPAGDQRKNDSATQLVTLPRTAKSPEVCRTLKDREFFSDPNIQQNHFHCSMDGERTLFSVARNAPSAKYFSLMGNDKIETEILGSEDGDLDNDIEFHVPVRRTSEGQGCQAVVLTSLLNSWESAANENIDV